MALIMDDIREIRKYASQTGSSLRKLDGKSLAAKAKDATFQFPVLISDSIPIDRASTLVNYIEPVYATLVQIAVSGDNRINLGTTNIDQWLKARHQNIKLESVYGEPKEYDDFFGIFERAYDGNAVLFLNDDESMGIMVRYTNEHAHELMESNRKQLTEYMSNFDMKPFPITEKPADNSNEVTNSQLLNAYVTGKQDKEARDQRMKELDMSLKYSSQENVPKLLDRDIKKLNNMVPYGLELKLVSIADDGSVSQFVSIIVGIKAILHLIHSNEMIENLGNSVKSRNLMMNLVRWTSGEISFVKDLLLHIDDLKLDVSNMSNGYSRWFPTLKRLRDRKVQFKSFSMQRLIPNVTIALTSYEVDEIERRYGFNLKDTRFSKKIIETFFLCSLIILDEGTQTVDIIMQGDDEYQTYALETLDREVNLNSNRLSKEIGRMISR